MWALTAAERVSLPAEGRSGLQWPDLGTGSREQLYVPAAGLWSAASITGIEFPPVTCSRPLCLFTGVFPAFGEAVLEGRGAL